jgi:phage-related protein
MYLKTDKIIVKIKNVMMQSSTIDNRGFQYILDPTAMIGWTDGVDGRRETKPRPVSDGDFADKATNAARLVSISGAAVAKSVLELKKMRDEFIGLLADGEYHWMSVEDAIGIRAASVGLETKPSWIQQSDTAATWRLNLYMPNPFIYGPEKNIQINELAYKGGMRFPLMYPISYNRPALQYSESIYNNGNVGSWPTFKVTGEFPLGFVIAYEGKKLQYNGAVTMHSPVTIDSAQGSAEQNGVNRNELLSSRDWFSIPPNGSIKPSFVSIENGPGWCDIIYRDTWI